MTVKSDYIATQHLKVGTRGSPLALYQANAVRDAILSYYPSIEVEIVIITTSGDWRPVDGETRLKEALGGKGQFAKEIEAALLAKEIDIAVHSMKDMEASMLQGLYIPCLLHREDPRDAFLSNIAQNIYDIPSGSIVGTASVRRQAFLMYHRKDLQVVPLRGNVQTRIDKMYAGQVDATFLAYAGLKRLGLSHHARSLLSLEEMLPSAGQGAIGVQIRQRDEFLLPIIDRLNCPETMICVTAERSVLKILDASCHTPIGVYAVIENGVLRLRASVASCDGGLFFKEEAFMSSLNLNDAIRLGEDLGWRLKHIVPDYILSKYSQ